MVYFKFLKCTIPEVSSSFGSEINHLHLNSLNANTIQSLFEECKVLDAHIIHLSIPGYAELKGKLCKVFLNQVEVPNTYNTLKYKINWFYE